MNSTLKKLAARVKSGIARGLIKAVVDTGEIQLVKVSTVEGDTQDGIERLQPFGLSSNPPVGSEAVIMYFGGNREDGIVLMVDSGANRPTGLEAGEAQFYSEFAGYVKSNKDGKLELSGTAGTAVRFSSLETAFNQLKSDFDTFASSHTHTGVTTGPGASGTVAVYVPSTADIAPAEVTEVTLP